LYDAAFYNQRLTEKHAFEEVMSTHDHGHAQGDVHEEAHTGPIKTPSQVLWASIASFVIPIFVIIGLVYFVVSGFKPQAGAVDAEKAIANRIAKVGSIQIKDAATPLKAGEDVYKAQCVACHGAGVGGAPKFGDAAAWSARIKTGYEALLTSALKGKGTMGAQGGGDFEDAEIGRAVVYMTNAAGAKFAVPERAAAPTAAATAATGTATADPVAAAATAAAAQVAAALASAKPVAVDKSAIGKALYEQACTACHAAGIAGAPKFGDKAAWAARAKEGVKHLTEQVIKGKGVMPAGGGSPAGTSPADIQAAVEYMLAAAK
jgi:cytochrome c5